MADGQTDAPADDGTPAGDDKGTPTPKPTDEGKRPKWDGEFDADRAASLVANLRTEKEDLATKVKALEAQIAEKGGTEQTLQERLEAMEARLQNADRELLVSKIAKAHSIPEDLLDLLTGKDEASLTAQAERLAAYAKKPADDVAGKPKPKLTPGRGGDPEDDFDAQAIAKAVRRR